MSIERLTIPEDGLVIYPEKYKVVDVIEVLDRRGSGRFGYKKEMIQAALVIPKTPGDGWLTSGLDMMLVRIRNGELSTNDSDVVILRWNGIIDDYEVSGTGFSAIWFDNERSWREYNQWGYGERIEELKALVDQHSEIFESENPVQGEWEEAAKKIAPTLAKFFDIRPDRFNFSNFRHYFGLHKVSL